MKKNFIILCFIALFFYQVQAQEDKTVTVPRFHLGIESGASVLFGDINNHERIRSYHDYGFLFNFFPRIENDFSFYYLGIKPEYVLHKRIAIAAGVRFSLNTLTLGSDRKYFLWKVHEEGTNTDYLTIQKISQKKYYIGIPLEVKFFPRVKDYIVRHYFIFGAVLNFLVASDSDVLFQNTAMEKYASDVLGQIGNPNFHGQLFGGIGLKIGKTDRPFGNIELRFPIYMLTKEQSNSLIKENGAFGFGLQATFQIPIFSKHQLVYKVN
jgi:hypothetical protein